MKAYDEKWIKKKNWTHRRRWWWEKIGGRRPRGPPAVVVFFYARAHAPPENCDADSGARTTSTAKRVGRGAANYLCARQTILSVTIAARVRCLHSFPRKNSSINKEDNLINIIVFDYSVATDARAIPTRECGGKKKEIILDEEQPNSRL